MPTYVEVAVNVPRISGVFHYHLPAALEDQIRPGQLVVVPFGKQTVQGVVIKFVDQPEVADTRPVQAILDPSITLTPHQLALAAHLAESTLAPLADCIGLMTPPGLSQQADTLYTLLDTGDDPPQQPEELQARLIALLRKRGQLRGRQIDRALPRRNWKPAARVLFRQGRLESQSVLPMPRVRPKYVRTAQLAVPPEIARAELQGLSKKANVQERRQRILEFLIREPEPVDLSWVYAESGGNLSDLKRLDKLGLIMLREEEAWRDPLAGLAYDPAAPLTLTNDQQSAWQSIQEKLGQAFQGQPVSPILLHGVTGSGKTELYLRAVAETIQAGKQAIVLVPEIALTPQTVRRFIARFPGRVGLLHSRLSDGERYDTWRRARTGALDVIIGPRSALFAPLPELGLVVVDESHDESYYHSGRPPYYHARDAAAAAARLAGAVCLLGSATPDLTSYHRAKAGRWIYLQLPARILAHTDTVRAYSEKLGEAEGYRPAGGQVQMTDLPPVEVVDMRTELKNGNRSIFSRSLQEALKEVLQKNQQALLFLNRRGTATYIFCRDCGQTLTCPRCDTNLTYHLRVENAAGVLPNQRGKAALICHHCAYTRQMPETCPNCRSDRIRHYGTGTERVQAEVEALLPAARTLRWDYESTRKKGAHEIILSHFANHRADILIGTQMLAKGLDLPRVTLVGVVLADVGLGMPDYRAGERVFQVLTQVAGRAGRSPLGGRVVLQTFDPGHYVIETAAQHDYTAFSERELAYREQLRFPPYARLARLEYRHHRADAAEAEAGRMAAQLRARIEAEERRATELIGPAPCFYTRLDGKYRWQIILRGPDPASMLAGKKLGDWRVEVNPQALL